MHRKKDEHHGLTRNDRQTPEYRIWAQIIQRCLNPKCVKYPLYGGRGVKMAPVWRNSFTRFLKDVGKRPSKKHSLGRLDPRMGYCSGNVQWMDRKELARHTTRNRIVRYEDKDYVLAELAEKMGIDRKRLQDRLVSGFHPKEAVELPVEGGQDYYTYNGEKHNLGVWARKLKIPYGTLYSRIFKMHWTIEMALSAPAHEKGKGGVP